MKKLTDMFHINAFTSEVFKGNTAAVVQCENLKSDVMQKIAKQMNLSETAFLSKSDKADFKLRWFTPTIEVELCGHATIASLHYLKERQIISNKCEVSFETLSGLIDCKVNDDKYYMKLPVPDFQEFKGERDELLKILSLSRDSIQERIPIILQNSGNLFIYVKTLEAIKNLTPDFKKLHRLTKVNSNFTEVTVYTLETIEKGNHAHLRFFAPYYGIDEDPVTGSANGPLLLVLQKVGLVGPGTENKIFKFEQGDFVGRPGRINVTYSSEKNELVISGNAVTMMKGDIYI
jgi:PhzF family phenazine biosynthesis protein